MTDHTGTGAKHLLGCQIWIEPTDTRERIDHLFSLAAQSGLGWVRIFLMWPWLERNPGQWDFDVFDWTFDAANKHGILLKATLTANSGPWHIGTPSTLHSFTGTLTLEQRESMSTYIEKVVQRYRNHPALGQWILWNEPSSRDNKHRTPYMLENWRNWLQEEYRGSLDELNLRWLTGYRDFSSIPFPEEISYVLHQGSHWNSYRPWIDDCKFRAWHLIQDLSWVKEQVRRWDSKTETCVNPVPLLANVASQGVNLEGIGELVDVVGASYHPSWQFTFAPRHSFPALMAAGVRYQASLPTIDRVEVTEVQTGNTLNSSNRPSEVTDVELAKFYLASLAAGAESVTGWLFNVRNQDFEAGDWGMLDDFDQPSARTAMMKRLHDLLETIRTRTGAWRAAPAQVWVAYEPAAQVVEWIESKDVSVAGRLASDGAWGGATLTTVAMECGFSTTHARLEDIPQPPSGGQGLLIVSHATAWKSEHAERALAFAHAGGTLLIDGTTGRKNEDAALNKPWPSGLAEPLGMRAVGLETRPDGFEICLNGLAAGELLLARAVYQFDASGGWSPWEELVFGTDGESCVWERRYGKGRVILFRGLLGPSLVHKREISPVVKYVISRAGSHIPLALKPHMNHPYVYSIPMATEREELHTIIAPTSREREGQSLRLRGEPGSYYDYWTDKTYVADQWGQLVVDSIDGILILSRCR